MEGRQIPSADQIRANKKARLDLLGVFGGVSSSGIRSGSSGRSSISRSGGNARQGKAPTFIEDKFNMG